MTGKRVPRGTSFADLVQDLGVPQPAVAAKRESVPAPEQVEEFNVESNLGLLGLGGTGCRVTSQVFADDPMPLGLASSFGFDLDADERVTTRSKLYKYT